MASATPRPRSTRWRAYCDGARAAGVSEMALTEHLFRFRPGRPVCCGGSGTTSPTPRCGRRWQSYWDDHARADLDAYVDCVLAAKDAGLPVVLGLEVDYYRGRMDDVAALARRVSLRRAAGIGPLDRERGASTTSTTPCPWRSGRHATSTRPGATTSAPIEELAATSACDVLAHPDLVKAAGHRPLAPEECWDRLVEAAVGSGMAAELSSAGWRKPADEAYPAPGLLERFVARGRPAHHRVRRPSARRCGRTGQPTSPGCSTPCRCARCGRFAPGDRVRRRPRRRGARAMKTPAELAATHTDLDAASLDHLQRLLGSWGVLSDLSFSDLLLVAPVRGSDGAQLIVLGQIRPTTWATLLRVDLVGQIVESADWPVVTEALQDGHDVVGARHHPGSGAGPAGLGRSGCSRHRRGSRRARHGPARVRARPSRWRSRRRRRAGGAARGPAARASRARLSRPLPDGWPTWSPSATSPSWARTSRPRTPRGWGTASCWWNPTARCATRRRTP